MYGAYAAVSLEVEQWSHPMGAVSQRDADLMPLWHALHQAPHSQACLPLSTGLCFVYICTVLHAVLHAVVHAKCVGIDSSWVGWGQVAKAALDDAVSQRQAVDQSMRLTVMALVQDPASGLALKVTLEVCTACGRCRPCREGYRFRAIGLNLLTSVQTGVLSSDAEWLRGVPGLCGRHHDATSWSFKDGCRG